MHFAGSNPATDQKCPKCIYKISKNFRVEKSGEISRNLRFSRFFVPASKSDTHHDWGIGIRTPTYRVRVCCATVTQFPNISYYVRIYSQHYVLYQMNFDLSTAFGNFFDFFKKIPLINFQSKYQCGIHFGNSQFYISGSSPKYVPNPTPSRDLYDTGVSPTQNSI